MKTINDLKTENWFYVQVFGPMDGQHTVYRTVVFATTLSEGIKKVYEWAANNKYDVRPISASDLYRKNYVREARQMVQSNNYIA